MKKSILFLLVVTVLISSLSFVYAAPVINFTDPTPANSTITSNNSVVINISITNASDMNEFKWNLNSTNYTFYNNSLVLMLNFDNVTALGENATKVVDVSSNSLNGTVYNAVFNATGKYGGAYQFNGSDAWINGTKSATNAVDNWAIAAWIKPSSLSQLSLAIYNGNDAAGYGFGIGNGAGLSGNKLTGLYGLVAWIDSGYTFASANTWYHVVMTRRSGTTYFYVNGAQTASTSASVPSAPNNYLTIGCELNTSNNPQRYFNGTIDEVYIYNRGLSANEIQQQYYSNLYKYDTDKWVFITNQSSLVSQGSYTYQGCANNTAGNQNCTETRVLYIGDWTPPNINFTTPTPANATVTKNTSIQINISITNATDFSEFKWNWNGTNYTFYNSSLVLMLNLDNVSALGENATKAVDVSPSSNNATFTNAPTWTTSGRYGSALNFAGTTYAKTTITGFSATTGTVLMWIKPNKDLKIVTQALFDTKPSAVGALRIYSNSDNTLRYETGGTLTPLAWTIPSDWTGQWHQIGLNWSGSTTSLIVDGAVVASGSNSQAPAITTFEIGRYNSGSNFNGTIDEVRAYSASLSANELRQQYYSNLNKYNTDKWVFITNQSNFTTGTYTYQGFAKDVNSNSNQTDLRYLSYTNDATPPTTSIISVAGDTTPSYFDAVNDERTNITISGEVDMLCRWSSSDIIYSSMSNNCVISGIQANCSINDVSSQGFTTRYVSCEDSLGNEQNTSQNLDINFYLDYTAPTTTSNANTDIHAPNYTVTITEVDNVDSDPTTYYCTSTSEGCSPTTSIDNGGTITYTSSNRSANYLRYYSIDDAGNIQTIVDKTININQLPVLTSASDNAVIIKGGATVNVSSVAYDSDSVQTLTLFVCNSSGATSSGCTNGHYCNSTGNSNLSCTFSSETDSSLHLWYVYIFDELGEAATANPLTGSYTTDSQAPTITLANPLNNSNITQGSVTFTIVVNKALTNAWYSLDSGVNNVSLSNVSLYLYTHANTSIVSGNYNLSLWANDSYGNIGSLTGNSFTISAEAGDTTKPEITIYSPVNASYSSSADILLNITTDESLSWAGYTNNSDTLVTLGNVSTTNWNSTITLVEGQHNITFYANDTSNNQANKSIVIYVDLTNPSVDAFSCTNPVNDSQDVNCSASLSDSIGLSYAIIGHNATGSWQNSSQISLAGLTGSLSYIISAGNTTPPRFTAQIYLYDLSGRSNLTTNYAINVSDDSYPEIYNITYSPNTTAELDPYVSVNVNATIVEDYKINEVELMWQNLSDGNWISAVMTNNSAIANGSSATVTYNASFLPGNGTYAFKINATDTAGNQNISANYTLIVANESSFWNSTTIPSIKSFTYAQRSDNNTLGAIYLNNTGDNSLNFNLNISASSPIQGKFDINYTNDDNASYSVSSGGNISLNLFVNTTGITTGLYPYNVTIVSEAGTTIYEKQIYIQTAEGPYLQISIDTFSSSVTTSQIGVTYAVSVTNLGTQDATGVYLNWTLPSIFTLSTGSLNRSLGTLPIGSSGTNTITIDVGSSTSDITYYINATAIASNADSVNTSKAISVSNPVTITQTITSGATGGGGGIAKAESVAYSKTIEVVRGEQDSFDIEVNNKYPNSSLEDLTLSLAGFLPQYIEIYPSKIGKINSKETKKFNIKLKIPSYKESYEEHTLKALISGYKVDGTAKTSYIETQNIKLVIQEVSKEKSNLALSEAEKAILEMKNAGFNTQEVSKLLEQAKLKLSENKNKKSLDLSDNVINIKNKAFSVNSLIEKISGALKDPKKTYLLTGNVAKEIVDENGEKVSINSVLTGKAIFSGESAENVLNMAIAAFKRGDFSTAEERAKSAQVLLLLERKGNYGFFLYLYWHFVLIGILIFSFAGILSYKTYQKSSITGKIQDINKEENNIRTLILSAQKNYFSGKISAGDYHRIMNQHQNKLAKIKQQRLSLRNKRIKMLRQQQILQDLENERLQVESEIIKLQEQYYRDRKISANEYDIEFKTLNERLAEIEGEKITLELLKKKKSGENQIKDSKSELEKEIIKSNSKIKKHGNARIVLFKIIGSLKSPFHHISKIRENKRLREEAKIKEKIKRMGVI
ncbi:MAG: Ig-like domain-containing protein [Candidatus Nanoarchaeia archaeon]|nr:Ig-like domain-containing protein [Candidatus Nanoarchaeia archaeon]MDD5740903.1 Ig-like domain-containing protein [Candidatus Nanoarchaeia archaeon]